MVTHPSLDPKDWAGFREQAHAALEAAIDLMQDRATAPVWRETPAAVKQRLAEDLPMEATDLSGLNARIQADVLPFGTGNTHPRFYGWVHGAGSPTGVIPDIYAAALNANLGGRDHVANEVEKQVIQWCRQIFDFPAAAGGLVVSGTSMATLIALKSARDRHAQETASTGGVRPGLVGYASAQSHSCVAQTFDIIGLGQNALRRIPVNDRFRMDLAALKSAIAKDKNNGLQPFCLIGTAGTVNTGAIDPLDALADVAKTENMWLHVDGAFGALAVLHADLKPKLAGIDRADSLAFDFHKWMHVNYDAGFILMRDANDQLRAFSSRPEYLQSSQQGLAAGSPWFCDFGPELSRGFRALKVWFQMKSVGLRRIGEKIAENCAQADYLAGQVSKHPMLELLAPTDLNITCFRFIPENHDAAALDQLTTDIVTQLQLRGLAAPSTTKINAKTAIRVNLTNHRTTLQDLDALIRDVTDIGSALSAERTSR